MISKLRSVYWLTAWLFVGSVLLQVFLIGLALFAGMSTELHAYYGSTLVGLLSIGLVALAIRARAGRHNIQLAVLLFVLVFIQGGLPALRQFIPVVAAVHPVTAFLVFWLGVHIARRAAELRRAPLATAQAAAAEALPAQT